MTSPSTTQAVHAADIQAAQAKISSVIEPTPLQYCPRLSQRYGLEVGRVSAAVALSTLLSMASLAAALNLLAPA